MYNAASLIKMHLIAELTNDHLDNFLIHICKSLFLDLVCVWEKPQTLWTESIRTDKAIHTE